jgi:hypothetical protein
MGLVPLTVLRPLSLNPCHVYMKKCLKIHKKQAVQTLPSRSAPQSTIAKVGSAFLAAGKRVQPLRQYWIAKS